MPLIAAIQTTSNDNIAHNLAMLAEHVASAQAAGAQLVVLPECCALMPRHPRQLRACAETHAGIGVKVNAGEGKIQRFLAQLAHRLRIWIIAGSVPLRSDCAERPYNSLLVYDAHGTQVARYDKIHMFDAQLANGERYCESNYTMPGDACVVQTTSLGMLGLSICYDLRFAEMYHKLATLGATILVVPAAFTVATGAAHWKPLLRARAIENACYVVASAQVGTHASGRQTYGHSMIIDPWGKVIAQRKTAPGVLLAQLEEEKLQRVRTQLPCQSHRRPELFA